MNAVVFSIYVFVAYLICELVPKGNIQAGGRLQKRGRFHWLLKMTTPLWRNLSIQANQSDNKSNGGIEIEEGIRKDTNEDGMT